MMSHLGLNASPRAGEAGVVSFSSSGPTPAEARGKPCSEAICSLEFLNACLFVVGTDAAEAVKNTNTAAHANGISESSPEPQPEPESEAGALSPASTAESQSPEGGGSSGRGRRHRRGQTLDERDLPSAANVY